MQPTTLKGLQGDVIPIMGELLPPPPAGQLPLAALGTMSPKCRRPRNLPSRTAVALLRGTDGGGVEYEWNVM